MPIPNPNETKNEYIKRCVRQLYKEEGRPQKQSVAIAYSMWKRHLHESNNEPPILDIDETLEILHEASLADAAVIGAGTLVGGPIGSTIATGAVVAKNVIKHIVKATFGSDIIASILKKYKLPDSIENLAKPDPSYLASCDDKSINNKIPKRPQGVIICDTFNNPIFPINHPIIDTSAFDLPDIKTFYQTYYTKLPVDYLPWHYVIEMIKGQYYVFQTRPLDMRYPVDNNMASELIDKNKNSIVISDSVEKFFLHQPFDLRDAIHVCLIGNSNKDVYLQEVYELIGRTCAGPIGRYFHLSSKTGIHYINFNLGTKFTFGKLDFYLGR